MADDNQKALKQLKRGILGEVPGYVYTALVVIPTILVLWGASIMLGAEALMMIAVMAAIITAALGYFSMFEPGVRKAAASAVNKIPFLAKRPRLRRTLVVLSSLLATAMVAYIAANFGAAAANGLAIGTDYLPTSPLAVGLITGIAGAILLGTVARLLQMKYGSFANLKEKVDVDLLDQLYAVLQPLLRAVDLLRMAFNPDFDYDNEGWSKDLGEADEGPGKTPADEDTSADLAAGDRGKKNAAFQTFVQGAGWLNAVLTGMVVFVMAHDAGGADPLTAAISGVGVGILLAVVSRNEAKQVIEDLFTPESKLRKAFSSNKSLVGGLIFANVMLSAVINLVFVDINTSALWLAEQMSDTVVIALGVIAAAAMILAAWQADREKYAAAGASATVTVGLALMLAVAAVPTEEMALAMTMIGTFVVITVNGLFFANVAIQQAFAQKGEEPEEDGLDEEEHAGLLDKDARREHTHSPSTVQDMREQDRLVSTSTDSGVGGVVPTHSADSGGVNALFARDGDDSDDDDDDKHRLLAHHRKQMSPAAHPRDTEAGEQPVTAITVMAFLGTFTLMLGLASLFLAPQRLADLTGSENFMEDKIPEDVADNPAYIVGMLVLVLAVQFLFYRCVKGSLAGLGDDLKTLYNATEPERDNFASNISDLLDGEEVGGSDLHN